MATISTLAKRTILSLAAALVTLFFPGVALAETTGETVPDPSTTTQTTTVTPPAPQGPATPPGADGKTYKYNPATGLYENDYYTWDPVTKKTIAKNPKYYYDPVTDTWSSDNWKYNPATGKYEKVAVPIPQGPPPGATVAVDQPTTTSGDTSSANSPCGCSSDNNALATSDLHGATAVAMVNGISATAISGNANVAHNTLGGNALSGSATVVNNTVNLLQSGLSLGGGGATPTTFVANIEGNVSGDLVIDPSLLTMLQPAGSTGGWANTNINTTTDTSLTNNIALASASGDATVAHNTTGGDATTGNANTLANVMNLANSNITAAGSFVGMINIYGNLDGDVLLPPGTLEKILGNDVPTVTLDASKIAGGEMLANMTNNTNIDNNVTAYAQSGNATVDGNTGAGKATTGDSSTNVTLLNLTGRQVIGTNTLLVFVNVLGKWVGAIMDAPVGTKAIALTDGEASSSASGVVDGNSTNSTNITNNIDLSAITGDASVTKNTQAGNATSGNATASANILNVSNSSLSLSGWLGILFINVFGTWNGDFNNDTPAGNQPAATGTTDPVQQNNNNAHVFSLTHDTSGNYRVSVVNNQSSTGEGEEEPTMVTQTASIGDDGNVLGAATTGQIDHSSNWGFVTGGLLLSCCLAAYERFRAFRSHRALLKI